MDDSINSKDSQAPKAKWVPKGTVIPDLVSEIHTWAQAYFQLHAEHSEEFKGTTSRMLSIRTYNAWKRANPKQNVSYDDFNATLASSPLDFVRPYQTKTGNWVIFYDPPAEIPDATLASLVKKLGALRK